VQVVRDITEWFEDMDAALERVLALIGTRNRSAFEPANNQLLAVLVRGQELPPIPDADAQRHFAAGLARYKDGAETPRDDGRSRRSGDKKTGHARDPGRGPEGQVAGE